MVGAEIGAGTGHAVLRVELGALGVEHGLEVDQPAVVALARQQRSVAGRLGGQLQATAGVRGRRAARPARLPRPSAPSARQPGRPCRAWSSAACCARTWARRAPPSNTGSDTLASSALTHRRAAGQRAQRQAVQTQRTAQLEVRHARRLGLRYARQRGRHLVFGGAHVGPLAQRLGGNAQRQVVGRLRHRAGRGQHRRQGRRRLAGQHRERMTGLFDGWSATPATGRASVRRRRAPARLRAR